MQRLRSALISAADAGEGGALCRREERGIVPDEPVLSGGGGGSESLALDFIVNSVLVYMQLQRSRENAQFMEREERRGEEGEGEANTVYLNVNIDLVARFVRTKAEELESTQTFLAK